MISYGLSGHFKLEVRDAATGNLKQVREFDNLITDIGLDTYGYGDASNLNWCWIGTCDDEPTPSDVGLVCPIAHAGLKNYSQNDTVAPTAPDWISSRTRTYRFAAGLNGEIKEVGISTGHEHSDSNFRLWCRALICDDAGVPTPLLLTPVDVLDVHYTLRQHPIVGDVTGSFTLGTVTYNYVSRPARIQDNVCGASGGMHGLRNPSSGGIVIERIYNGGQLGTIQQEIVNYNSTLYINPFYTGYPVAQTYVPGSFRRDYWQPCPLDEFNLEGGFDGFIIGCINDTSSPQFHHNRQVKLDKPIPKDNTCALRILLRTSWRRWSNT